MILKIVLANENSSHYLSSPRRLKVLPTKMKIHRKTTVTTLTAAALCIAAVQLAPAQTFNDRLAKVEAADEVAEADLNASFTTQKKTAWYDRFMFGSYGEAHFNTGDVHDKFDIHRLVLFTAYEFNDRFRFVSEVELEHLYSNDPKTDIEWELEQAYFELDLGNDYHLIAGGFLVPVGILNEVHEPTTFYGVERNRVETEIIPTTWTEYGLLLRKNYDNGLQWDFAVHRGLSIASKDFNKNGPDIRDGRQKTDSFHGSAATARVKYNGITGLELGAAIQIQDDISRNLGTNSALLTSAHVIYNKGGFGLRALAANWDINGRTAVGGVTVPGSTIDNQYGTYVEPAYKWTFDNGMAVGIFTRYTYFKNEDFADGQTEYHAGVNFWPTEHTVLKADWAHEDRTNGRDNQNVYNFGVGYAF